MMLTLKYQVTEAKVGGAFIKGNLPAFWLQEISRWNIPVEQLSCFLVPESLSAANVFGLFVIFKNLPPENFFLEPYYTAAPHVFLPHNTVLSPQVSADELKNILIWDVQVFHPVSGLIGFAKTDAVRFSNFIDEHIETDVDWSFAQHGNDMLPVFNEIQVKQPTMEELIESIKDDVASRLPEELPGNEKRSTLQQLLDRVKLAGFKALQGILNLAGKIPVTAGTSSNNNGSNTGETFGERLQKWIDKNIDDLEQKREDEIRRLLSLFENNTDEALKYAIPLGSPYASRGKAQQSSRLVKHNTDFNLGGLGGGSATDAWTMGDQYHQLRNSYLQAAQREIDQKNFKKAAYIYAHLLGDFIAAANVLEQGGFYREAATLHKDHLKNMAAAAACLEHGALYNEAINIYSELNQHEKVGDLYGLISQAGNARTYYEKSVAITEANNDHLDAARIVEQKLNEPERAKALLLTGWNGERQAEPCLKKYFDLVLKTEKENTTVSVETVYNNAATAGKKLAFLNVLEYVRQKNADETLHASTQQMAYEIISAEAGKGNLQPLHNLSKFVQGDKLISAESSRYANNPKNIRKKAAQDSFQLDSSIVWKHAVIHRNQYLAIGMKDAKLHLARGNWYGNLEYYSWTNQIEQKPWHLLNINDNRFTLSNEPFYSDNVYINCSGGETLAVKTLPKNRYFNETVTVAAPAWLSGKIYTVEADDLVCLMDMNQQSITLHYYSSAGMLIRSQHCDTSGLELSKELRSTAFCKRKLQYYTYSNDTVIVINSASLVYSYNVQATILSIAVSTYIEMLHIVVDTSKGCYLASVKNETLTIHPTPFATHLTPRSICFISENLFIICEKRDAHLFHIENDEPFFLQSYVTKNNILNCVPGGNRNQFALLEENGNILICEVE